MNTELLIATGGAAGLLSFLPTILMFVALIYFMIVRPQKKRQQNAKNLLDSIVVGDKIQTIGGFIGDIVEMNGEEFIIVSEGNKLRIKKSAVALKLSVEESTTETKTKTKTKTKKKITIDKKETSETVDEDFKIEDFEI